MAIAATQLALTEIGRQWIGLFDDGDQELAETILSALTLVSNSEFERGLLKAIHSQAECVPGIVALFATREFQAGTEYFDLAGAPVNAVERGGDLGSEARVAAIIRNLAREQPEKYLTHPTIEQMHSAKCRAIFMVDDFNGSGERTSEFFAAFWVNPRLRSWHSLQLLSFYAISYSATEEGLKTVQRRTRAKVILHRDCPTFHTIPWPRHIRRRIFSLFARYAPRLKDGYYDRGYGHAAAALVFEHGCPDNCPPIFWSRAKIGRSWRPIFPERSVALGVRTAFPLEIVRPEPTELMLVAGEEKLSRSGTLSRRGPIGQIILIVLGIIAQGVRSRTSIAYATGLEVRECSRIIRHCVKWKFINVKLRLTATGYAELNYARGHSVMKNKIPDRGTDVYYPSQLRRSSHG